MIKYKNNINVGTGSVGYEADATSAAPLDSVNEGRIVKSEGRTVKWNQLVNTATTEVATVNGHKYLTKINGVKDITTSTGAAITIYDVSTDQVFDLTQMFGAGNEPATVEAFESWLAENMVEQDYYAYDAGSLVPVTVKGVKRDVGGTTVTNPMPVTTLKDDNDVVMFPDGLKSAGSVKDEIDWENGVAVKKIGVVDLGDLTWAYNSQFNCFTGNIATVQPAAKKEFKGACADYPFVGIYLNRVDKSSFYIYNTTVGVQDTSFGTDKAAFKTAMQGVLLYYELATPITYHFATHTQLKKRVVKIGESVEVDGIEGETVIWNQLVENGDFSDGVNGWGKSGSAVTISASNKVCSWTINGEGLGSNNLNHPVTIVGLHKYYIKFEVRGSEDNKLDGALGETAAGGYFTNFSYGTSWSKCNAIVSPNETLINQYLYIRPNALVKTSFTAEFRNIFVVDLTAIFGSGNEPATVAEFESWLSAHGGIKDYYPYCAGELKDKEEGEVRGVGFNLWDEEWEEGSILADTGVNVSISGAYRSKNYIPCLPSTNYYLTKDNGIQIYEYDASKNYIGIKASNNGFSTSQECYYFRFRDNTSSTYNHDICINLSDASRNGTYVPYKSITRSVDLTTLKGKVDGAGEDVVMFPDGMKQAGSVKDEIFVEGGVVKAVKRVGTVDLGDLTWRYNGTVGEDGYQYIVSITDRAYTGNGISNRYNVIAAAQYNRDFDVLVLRSNGNQVTFNTKVHVDDATFKASMSGVMLNYELASPVTYVVNMQGLEMADVKKVLVGTQKVWEKP